MTGFGGGGLDLTNGQFIEIWVNDFTQDPLRRGGKLRIDMGTIDEDFWEPEKSEFNDEDRDRDGFAAAFDDTGLDGEFNDTEICNGCADPNDPNGDDLDLTRQQGRFTKVNGTEANRAYDTEDLDGNTQLDQINAYFSYEIDLASAAAVDISQEFPNYEGFEDPGHQHDAWRKYRVCGSATQRSSHRIAFSPALTRSAISASGFGKSTRFCPTALLPPKPALAIASRWPNSRSRATAGSWMGCEILSDELVDTLVVSTDITIGVISNKTDPGVYFPPVRPREDANGVQDKESSLTMVYDSLAAGNQARIRKQFAGNGIDLSQYRELHFWVNTDSFRTDVEYYYRMGTNEDNFYEVGSAPDLSVLRVAAGMASRIGAARRHHESQIR